MQSSNNSIERIELKIKIYCFFLSTLSSTHTKKEPAWERAFFLDLCKHQWTMKHTIWSKVCVVADAKPSSSWRNTWTLTEYQWDEDPATHTYNSFIFFLWIEWRKQASGESISSSFLSHPNTLIVHTHIKCTRNNKKIYTCLFSSSSLFLPHV